MRNETNSTCPWQDLPPYPPTPTRSEGDHALICGLRPRNFPGHAMHGKSWKIMKNTRREMWKVKAVA